MVNVLVISEILPRIATNVENSLPVLHTEEMVQSETESAKINLIVQLVFICCELVGLMTGLTLFQYIQSVISIGKLVNDAHYIHTKYNIFVILVFHSLGVIILGIYLSNELPNPVLHVALFVFTLPPFLFELVLWLYTFCYKKIK